MSGHTPNVYEQFSDFDQEAKRLDFFKLPNEVSIDLIGEIRPGMTVLDIGSGTGRDLGRHIEEQGGLYIAFDTNEQFIGMQRAEGTLSVRGDALQLPFPDEVFDVTHARFLLGHLSETGRHQAIEEAFGVTKPGGRVLLIDFNWSPMKGSDAINRLKAFTYDHIRLFDPEYGKKSHKEVFTALKGHADVGTRIVDANRQFNYDPVLDLREVTVRGLRAQGEDAAIIEEAHEIFDDIQREADQPNPPGFFMPDIVATTVRKH